MSRELDDLRARVNGIDASTSELINLVYRLNVMMEEIKLDLISIRSSCEAMWGIGLDVQAEEDIRENPDHAGSLEDLPAGTVLPILDFRDRKTRGSSGGNS